MVPTRNFVFQIVVRESSIEKQLTHWAEEHGIYTRKFVSPGHSGVPDRLFLGPKGVLFLELKAPEKKPTALQLREIDLINNQKSPGVTAAWAPSLELGKELVRKYCL